MFRLSLTVSNILKMTSELIKSEIFALNYSTALLGLKRRASRGADKGESIDKCKISKQAWKAVSTFLGSHQPTLGRIRTRDVTALRRLP